MTRTEEVKVMNAWFDQHNAGKPPAAVVPVPQNSSTVHRGQLPSPGTWGATERAGLCPEVPAERTDWKPGLRGLCQYRTQIAGSKFPVVVTPLARQRIRLTKHLWFRLSQTHRNA